MNPADLDSGSGLRSPEEQSEWFRREIHAHDLRLKSYLRGAFPTLHDVDDVVQESYLKIWRARLRRPIVSAKSFLYQVARHIAIDLTRRRRISPEVALPDPVAESVMDGRPGVAETVCTREEIALLAQALHSLPDRCREVMILRQIEGLSQKEISTRLDISELTVQTHVVHGLRRVEAFMRRRLPERVRA